MAEVFWLNVDDVKSFVEFEFQRLRRVLDTALRPNAETDLAFKKLEEAETWSERSIAQSILEADLKV